MKLRKEYILLVIVVSLVTAGARFLFPDSDPASAAITVPGIDNDLALRIVTNASLNEIASRMSSHFCKIDLARHLLVYEESPMLKDPNYLTAIYTSLEEVGLTPEIKSVQAAPDPDFPGRHRLVLSIPSMKTRRDANIAVDAIGYARAGRNDSPIRAERDGGVLNMDFDSMDVELKNVEIAITSVGFNANDCIAASDPDAVPPQGWCSLNPTPTDLEERQRFL